MGLSTSYSEAVFRTVSLPPCARRLGIPAWDATNGIASAAARAESVAIRAAAAIYSPPRPPPILPRERSGSLLCPFPLLYRLWFDSASRILCDACSPLPLSFPLISPMEVGDAFRCLLLGDQHLRALLCIQRSRLFAFIQIEFSPVKTQERDLEDVLPRLS